MIGPYRATKTASLHHQEVGPVRLLVALRLAVVPGRVRVAEHEHVSRLYSALQEPLRQLVGVPIGGFVLGRDIVEHVPDALVLR